MFSRAVHMSCGPTAAAQRWLGRHARLMLAADWSGEAERGPRISPEPAHDVLNGTSMPKWSSRLGGACRSSSSSARCGTRATEARGAVRCRA